MRHLCGTVAGTEETAATASDAGPQRAMSCMNEEDYMDLLGITTCTEETSALNKTDTAPILKTQSTHSDGACRGTENSPVLASWTTKVPEIIIRGSIAAGCRRGRLNGSKTKRKRPEGEEGDDEHAVEFKNFTP